MADNVVLISGSDETAINSTAAEWVHRFAGDDPDPFSLDVVREGDDISSLDALNTVTRSLLSPSFMGGRKTVWLKGFAGFPAERNKGASGPLAAAFERLCEVIADGLPDDAALVISGPGVDARKRLHRTCKDHGTVIIHDRPDVKDRDWQTQVAGIIRAQATQKEMAVPPEVVEYLVRAVGTDTARVGMELEKLLVHAGGPGEPITLADAKALCRGDGEAISWALRDAVGARDLPEALELVAILLRGEQEGAVLGLILQIAGHVRSMLQARILIHQLKARSPRAFQNCLADMDPATKAQFVDQGLEVVTYHPYRAMLVAGQAMKFTGQELVDGLCALRDAYASCISSGISKRVVLENLIIQLCTSSKTR